MNKPQSISRAIICLWLCVVAYVLTMLLSMGLAPNVVPTAFLFSPLCAGLIAIGIQKRVRFAVRFLNVLGTVYAVISVFIALGAVAKGIETQAQDALFWFVGYALVSILWIVSIWSANRKSSITWFEMNANAPVAPEEQKMQSQEMVIADDFDNKQGTDVSALHEHVELDASLTRPIQLASKDLPEAHVERMSIISKNENQAPNEPQALQHEKSSKQTTTPSKPTTNAPRSNMATSPNVGRQQIRTTRSAAMSLAPAAPSQKQKTGLFVHIVPWSIASVFIGLVMGLCFSGSSTSLHQVLELENNNSYNIKKIENNIARIYNSLDGINNELNDICSMLTTTASRQELHAAKTDLGNQLAKLVKSVSSIKKQLDATKSEPLFSEEHQSSLVSRSDSAIKEVAETTLTEAEEDPWEITANTHSVLWIVPTWRSDKLPAKAQLKFNGRTFSLPGKIELEYGQKVEEYLPIDGVSPDSGWHGFLEPFVVDWHGEKKIIVKLRP